MTRFSATSPSLPAGAFRSLMMPRGATAARAPAAVFWLFMLFFLATLANVAGLVTRLISNGEEMGLHPIAFAVAFVLTAPWTKGRASSPYLTVSWIFVAAYAVFGFLGPYQQVGFDYQLAQLIVKLWIGVVGIPWLALRVVDKNRLPVVLKSSVLICALAGGLALLQVLFPKIFAPIVSEPGRGAGFWVNPNNCGVICGLMIFVSLYCPFRSKSLNLAVRTALLMGVFLSFSRGGIVGLAVGAIVYGIMAKRIRTVITLSIATALFIVAGKFALDVIGAQTARLKSRMERFEAVLSGDLGESSTARVVLWKHGFAAVSHDWLLGRGHGSMVHVVPIGGGIGPHNYYLFVWGNSGILALLAFLAWLFVLFRYGYRASDARLKAVLLAMVAMLAVFAMFDHSYIAHQFMGTVVAVVVLAGHFAQKDTKSRPVVAPRTVASPPAVRR